MVFGACLSLGTLVAESKKGVGYWEFPGAAKGLREAEVHWCYNWRLAPANEYPEGIEFVPMVWDERDATEETLETVRKSSGQLLGFNEPDHAHQADMPVELALDLWPRLEATGLRLGSPATADTPLKIGGWFERFMQGVEARGLRVDFIAVHFYSSRYDEPAAAVADLDRLLTNLYARYRRPIWLTEFALANWKEPATMGQQMAFLEQALPMLDRLEFVERYAWFALPPNRHGDAGALATSSLCSEDGQLNTLGNQYRQHSSLVR